MSGILDNNTVWLDTIYFEVGKWRSNQTTVKIDILGFADGDFDLDMDLFAY